MIAVATSLASELIVSIGVIVLVLHLFLSFSLISISISPKIPGAFHFSLFKQALSVRGTPVPHSLSYEHSTNCFSPVFSRVSASVGFERIFLLILLCTYSWQLFSNCLLRSCHMISEMFGFFVLNHLLTAMEVEVVYGKFTVVEVGQWVQFPKEA